VVVVATARPMPATVRGGQAAYHYLLPSTAAVASRMMMSRSGNKGFRPGARKRCCHFTPAGPFMYGNTLSDDPFDRAPRIASFTASRCIRTAAGQKK
jgi:hypothetical protein